MIKRLIWLLINIFSFCLGIGSMVIKEQLQERKKAILPCLPNGEVKKWKEFYWVFNKWLELKQKGESLEAYFQEREYKTVAVYGMRELGFHMINELENSSVRVLYCIDKNADAIKCKYEIYRPQDELPEVDVIVVTAIHYYEEIKEELSIQCSYPIVSLKEVVERSGR